MLYSLGQIIDTDFALIVQNDGWVVDGSKWRDEFFDYDYIGGPILNLLEFRDGKFYQRLGADEWVKHWDLMPPNLVEYQNGGFCLRSKKLLNAPRELGLNLEIAPPDLFNLNAPVSLSWSNNLHSEDFWLCGYKRIELENYGIRFAPQKVAAYFATDRTHYHEVHRIPLREVMGVHFGTDFSLVGINEIFVNNRDAFPNFSFMMNSSFSDRFFNLGYQYRITEEDLAYLKSRG